MSQEWCMTGRHSHYRPVLESDIWPSISEKFEWSSRSFYCEHFNAISRAVVQLYRTWSLPPTCDLFASVKFLVTLRELKSSRPTQMQCVHVQRHGLKRTIRARCSQLMRIQQQWVGQHHHLLSSTTSTSDQTSCSIRRQTLLQSPVSLRSPITRSRWQSTATLPSQETVSNAAEKPVCMG